MRQDLKTAAAAILGVIGAVMSAPAPADAAGQSPPSTPPLAQAPSSLFIPGYLPRGAAPDSLSLLPPAPRPGSASEARDVAESKALAPLEGGPRWRLAAQDADLHFPGAAGVFRCALGAAVDPQTTPRLYTLLRRTVADAGLATYPAKTHYKRARPFMTDGRPTCTPADEKMLRVDGSYPSGHAAIGWAWALILAEAAPDRADAVLARGRAFMESRAVCNVHWLSDVEAGGVVGAAVVARLHNDPAFRQDLEAAKAEIAAARAAASGGAPSDCAGEQAALALTPPGQP